MGHVANIFKERVRDEIMMNPENGNRLLFGQRVEEKYFRKGVQKLMYNKHYTSYHSILSQLLCLQRTDPLYKGIKIGNIMVDNNLISLHELDAILEDEEK